MVGNERTRTPATAASLPWSWTLTSRDPCRLSLGRVTAGAAFRKVDEMNRQTAGEAISAAKASKAPGTSR